VEESRRLSSVEVFLDLFIEFLFFFSPIFLGSFAGTINVAAYWEVTHDVWGTLVFIVATVFLICCSTEMLHDILARRRAYQRRP